MADLTKKLTSGKPMTLILGFALPLLWGMLFQQLYSLVDTIIVGQYLGKDALAAVGSTGSLNFLIIGGCMGITSGFTIPISQRFGAENYEGMRKYVANSIWLSIVISIAMTTIVSVMCRWILETMNTPSNIIEDAYAYILVIFFGIPVTFLYNLTAGIMRSLGDSKHPVYFLLLASGINIVLDIVLITVLNMGVVGPAIATVVSQLIAGLACLAFLIKKFPILKMSHDELKFSKHHAANLLGMGLPMGLQYSITAIGSVVLSTAVNSLGSDAVASITAGSRISMFLVCPFDALGSTMSTYAGQNVGAKRIDRVHQGMNSAIVLGAIYSVISAAITWVAGKYLLLLFLKPEETLIIGNAMSFLKLNTLFYFLLALVNIVRFTIQGMGFSSFAVIAGVCEMFARAGVAIILVPILGFAGAIWANPAAWIFADAFLLPAFFWCAKKLETKYSN